MIHTDKSILIVEDDPFIALDLEDIFLSAGFRVIGPVANVTGGLQLIESHKPDFATLDYNLSDGTSVPLSEKLETHNIPHLFISGQMERVIADNDMDGRRVISKPFDSDEVLETVNQLIN